MNLINPTFDMEEKVMSSLFAIACQFPNERGFEECMACVVKWYFASFLYRFRLIKKKIVPLQHEK